MTDQAHARHLDGIYRHQRYIYDLTREYYLLGRNRLLMELAPPAGGTILEIGCGTARNLIRAAGLYPNARLFGMDLSSEMLRTAQSSLRRRGLEEKVRLAYADATTFDAHCLFGVSRFDRIFLSYTLSMIPQWQAAIGQAFRQLAHNGSLHIVDFGGCEQWPVFARSALYAWLRRFSVTPRTTLPQELQELSRTHDGALRLASQYGGYATYAVLTWES